MNKPRYAVIDGWIVGVYDDKEIADKICRGVEEEKDKEMLRHGYGAGQQPWTEVVEV